MNTVEVQGRRYELASRWERWAGQFLDALICLAILVVGFLVLSILGIVAAILYVLFQDGLANGQSLGKKLMKTSVIDSNTANPCSFSQSFLRNLLLSILGFIDWVFIFGRKKQRLGDKAARTYVVKLGELPKMSPEELAGE
ncbi:MAG: RDD family protein [Candidatus Poribacteria bacterium]|nr:RDD family protein [Candidatus Poribacteria bacterium]